MSNQSPIDLKSYDSEDKDSFPYKTYKSTEDMYRKTYSNQYGSSFFFNGHTTQLNLDAADGVNAFTSRMGEKLFGTVQDFTGVQFHFHAGSEHTVDGKRHDFEMHTVHLTADSAAAAGRGDSLWQSFKGQGGDIGAAAVGILFSVEDYTADLTWAE
jgi:carbonic anhydrase